MGRAGELTSGTASGSRNETKGCTLSAGPSGAQSREKQVQRNIGGDGLKATRRHERTQKKKQGSVALLYELKTSSIKGGKKHQTKKKDANVNLEDTEKNRAQSTSGNPKMVTATENSARRDWCGE